ncbi:hypothetical protein DdX_14874 [Ditylenchus destructor]|uniref:Uncharacterized protein n=1 Tax=Ditylenchus destructor TaxID=166010 RepID=A0AAD4R1B6_9BILA|nr:hypothetical protein DdX_14874 [Ditylenchus destructor]
MIQSMVHGHQHDADMQQFIRKISTQQAPTEPLDKVSPLSSRQSPTIAYGIGLAIAANSSQGQCQVQSGIQSENQTEVVTKSERLDWLKVPPTYERFRRSGSISARIEPRESRDRRKRNDVSNWPVFENVQLGGFWEILTIGFDFGFLALIFWTFEIFSLLINSECFNSLALLEKGDYTREA